MINKNGKITLVPFRTGEGYDERNVKNTEGNNVLVRNDPMYAANFNFSRVQVGYSDSALNTNDYRVATAWNNPPTLIASSATYNETQENDFIAVYSSTWKNNTTDTITVRELGVYFHTDETNTDVMIARELVNKDLAPGESYTFTVTVG